MSKIVHHLGEIVLLSVLLGLHHRFPIIHDWAFSWVWNTEFIVTWIWIDIGLNAILALLTLAISIGTALGMEP